MFNEIFKELARLERGIKLSVNVPLDAEGYLDRLSPAENCRAAVKIHDDDWTAKVGDTRAFCPICRHEAPADEWNTPEQLRYLTKVAKAQVSGMIDKALEIDARRFNRSQRPGFIQVSLSVTPSAPPVILPIAAAEAMRQQFTCDVCGCRYSAIGAAFFCAACGHNSVLSSFDQAVAIVRKTMADASEIRRILTEARDKDVAQNTVRDIVENGMGRLVGAFEHLAKALYEQVPGTGKLPRPNIFQNIVDGSDLWRKATGKGYEDFLSAAEMNDIIRLFQQRHVLTHCQGIVDHQYIAKSGDHTYAVGRRLVIREADVMRLAELVATLGAGLRTLVP